MNQTEAYKISLKFINELLINLGKNKIENLLEFKDIDREHIISEASKKIFTDMEKELFKQFDKVKCGWYRRNDTKNYIFYF